MKLKNHHKLVIAADGTAASGKTTGAKLISKKYGLQFLSSGLLYRYASYHLLKEKPKNIISFLKKRFNNLSLKKLNNKLLHSPEISKNTSIIAKQQIIRNILKNFQRRFAKKFNKVCIEGRDIGTV
ncbi:MAG: (d)CMP kinase, partial [bacterium]|nr:(d)CMP kinase [bacterium]